jgi:hypothetical protein
MRKLPMTLSTVATLALPSPVTADDLYNTYFANAGQPCYAQLYDVAHMKAHPRQTVSAIDLDFVTVNDDGKPNRPSAFELNFTVLPKGSDGWFTGWPTCKTASDHFVCSLSNGSSGQFTLTPQGSGLIFTVVSRAGTTGDQIQLLSPDHSSSFGRPGGDDLVFLLPHVARDVCKLAG